MKKLLIIDDEVYVEKMQSMLDRRGIKSIWEKTGKLGILSYEEFNPDVVLLDYNLPDMTGIDVLKKIKETNSDVVAYFLSGEPTEEIQNKAKKLGAKGFFMKPVNMISLLNVIMPNEENL